MLLSSCSLLCWIKTSLTVQWVGWDPNRMQFKPWKYEPGLGFRKIIHKAAHHFFFFPCQNMFHPILTITESSGCLKLHDIRLFWHQVNIAKKSVEKYGQHVNGSFLNRHYLENDNSGPDFFMTHTTGLYKLLLILEMNCGIVKKQTKKTLPVSIFI